MPFARLLKRIGLGSAGLLLLTSLAGAGAVEDIAWNLTLPASSDGSHTGRILVTLEGQLHHGAGYTGTPGAVYHFHPRNEATGGLGTAIPLDEKRKKIALAAGNSTSFAPIDRRVEGAALTGNWEKVVSMLTMQKEPLASPVAQLLLGHGLLALNRNNESFLLLWSASANAQRKAWDAWTAQIVQRTPASPVAHYLRGDALARLGRWVEAIGEFNESLRLDPRMFMAQNARGVVRASLGQWEDASDDLEAVSQRAPGFSDGHINLGTFWIQRRAPDGARGAFAKALERSPTAVLAHNGRACAQYGDGKWEQAAEGFSEAGRYGRIGFVLNNLRAVTVAADLFAAPGSDTSPLFRLSDFLDWDVLRARTRREGDLLHAILADQPLPVKPDPATLERLNRALNDPQFYERHQRKFDLKWASMRLLDLLKSTKSARHKEESELTAAEKEQIRVFNRLLIELVYPSLIAHHHERKPAMQLTATNGLVNPFSSLQSQIAQKQQMPTDRLVPAYGRMQVQEPFARGITDIGNAVAGYGIGAKNPVAVAVGSGLSGVGQTWTHMLNVGKTSTDLVLAHRGIAPAISNPNGVLIDLRRAYVDKGNWEVETPFGLAYYAPALDEVTQ